jgi:hypothetical protein
MTFSLSGFTYPKDLLENYKAESKSSDYKIIHSKRLTKSAMWSLGGQRSYTDKLSQSCKEQEGPVIVRSKVIHRLTLPIMPGARRPFALTQNLRQPNFVHCNLPPAKRIIPPISVNPSPVMVPTKKKPAPRQRPPTTSPSRAIPPGSMRPSFSEKNVWCARPDTSSP